VKTKYEEEVRPALMKARGYRNVLECPRIVKVVVNMGFGTAVDKDEAKQHVEELTRIVGQRPMVTRARLSISNFRLREGMEIGAKVTLRGARMYEFLTRLIQTALPRIRDFRGVSAKSFDGRGNFTLGLQDQTIFPEIEPDDVKRTQGMDVCIVTTAQTDDEARELLAALGMPFAKGAN
jgi:large subunit ribosomal protein L5